MMMIMNGLERVQNKQLSKFDSPRFQTMRIASLCLNVAMAHV